MRALAWLCLAWLAAGAADAQTVRYVTDELKLEARRGPSLEHLITRYLESGTPVTVLEEDAESGYSRVRLEDGEEVWILTRYLVDEPAARDRLDDALERLAVQREAAKRLTVELETLRGAAAEIDQERNELARDKQELKRELAQIKQAASDALAIKERNAELEEKVDLLDAAVDDLRRRNRSLMERSERDWFIAGAGVLFGGLLLGLLIPKIRWRRRRGWNEL